MLFPMRIFRALALLALILASQGIARAQIVTDDNSGEERLVCMGGGLSSDLRDCGTRAHWYTYVFVGSISGIAPGEDNEKELQLVPEELFLGVPPAALTVSTSGAQCLRELKVGDRWLFYLRRSKPTSIVLQYGSDSLPAADASVEIDTLRRLKTIGDFAIVRGEVFQRSPDPRKAIPQAKVNARRVSDGLEFVSTTDAEGRYEFPLLPPGEYTIVVDLVGSFQPDDSGVDATPGACWDLALSRSRHAEIGGSVIRSDGSAVPNVAVVLIGSNNSYETMQTDSHGHFVFSWQEAGEFVVGLNFPPKADWFDGAGGEGSVTIHPASVFYPGVANRSEAGIIRLAIDQKIDNIDFTLPAE